MQAVPLCGIPVPHKERRPNGYLHGTPPKKDDKRAFEGETCQAEAIPPDLLAQIVLDAIEARLDRHAWESVIEREREARQELVRRFA